MHLERRTTYQPLSLDREIFLSSVEELGGGGGKLRILSTIGKQRIVNSWKPNHSLPSRSSRLVSAGTWMFDVKLLSQSAACANFCFWRQSRGSQHLQTCEVLGRNTRNCPATIMIANQLDDQYSMGIERVPQPIGERRRMKRPR